MYGGSSDSTAAIRAATALTGSPCWVPWTMSCSLRRLPAVSASSAIGSADWVSERPAKSLRNPPGSTTIACRPD